MKKQHIDLLIKDLSSRLPYRVKAYVKYWSKIESRYIEGVYTVESIDVGTKHIVACSDNHCVEVILESDDYEIKPYLFSISSMTDEQKTYLKHRFCYDWDTEEPFELWKCQIEIGDADELVSWFNENHIDYRNLIFHDLANEAAYHKIYN